MNKMRHDSRGQSRGLRLALLAGVSVVALAAASPNAGAADLSSPMAKKAPPPTPAAVVKERWDWWIEGGAMNVGGGDINPGAPGFGNKAGWGPEGAIGFDWQPVGPMHVVGQFRYGTAQKSRPFSFNATGGGTTISATGSQRLREDHWLVDFGIGRDFGLGAGKAMWTLGVRVADLRAKWTASGSFHATTTTPASPTGASHDN